MKPLVRSLLLVVLAGAALAAAGDQAKAPPSPAPTPEASPGPEPEEVPELEEFVPTEKVKADDAVAFPVDI